MTTFAELGLEEKFVSILERMKLVSPTEIQEKTIPLALQGKDIIAGSATGSGKTLAFGAGIIQGVERGKGVQAMIMAPTRELAEQVGRSLHAFSAHKQLSVAIVYGGVGISPQINAIARSEIVVGTPGRILDHIERGTLKFDKLKVLVLDEADRMLDMGFIDDVEKIILLCPRERQTLLFSATISPDIAHLAKKYMKSPVSVEVKSYVDASQLEQVYYDVPNHLKFSLLVHLLKEEKGGLVMVFCNTRRNTDFVANNLQAQKIEAMGIHGGLSQEKRNRIMKSFHSGHVYVLVCTDVAARGLDIRDVSHVYNYDLPADRKDYIHRIGRTARAGKEGKAISLVSQRDYEAFSKIMEDTSLKINPVEVPFVPQLRLEIPQRRGFGGRGNFRREGMDDRRSFGRGQGRQGSYGRPTRGGPSGGQSRYGGRREAYGSRGSMGSGYGRSREGARSTGDRPRRSSFSTRARYR